MKRVLSTGSIPALAVDVLCAATAAVAQECIKIGIPLELSDRFVAYGASGTRGAELAAEIYGDKVASKKIELLVRDIQSESQAAISVFNEFNEPSNKEKVNYKPVHSSMCAVDFLKPFRELQIVGS
jgi:branched-chain amino acid transport system substrate-binding protein